MKVITEELLVSLLVYPGCPELDGMCVWEWAFSEKAIKSAYMNTCIYPLDPDATKDAVYFR